jgi:hypothetical protein
MRFLFHRNIRPLLALAILPALLISTGCEELTRTDLVASGSIRAEAGDSSKLDISPPKVFREGDQIEITGSVARKPGSDQSLANGYVLIQFLTSAGDEFDEIWSTWDPAEIPTDGSRQSTYEIHYLSVPPPGTTIRVVYGPSEPGLASSGKGIAAGGGGGHRPPAAHTTGGYGNGGGGGFGFSSMGPGGFSRP